MYIFEDDTSLVVSHTDRSPLEFETVGANYTGTDG